MNAPRPRLRKYGSRTVLAPCPSCWLDSTAPMVPGGHEQLLPGAGVESWGGWVCHRCHAIGGPEDLARFDMGEKWARGPSAPGVRLAETTQEIWEEAEPVSQDWDARIWLELRGVDVERAAELDLCRVLRWSTRLPAWAVAPSGRGWAQAGCRLVLKLSHHSGLLATLAAVRLDAAAPRMLLPAGVSSRGLVWSCPLGRRVLSGELTSAPALGVADSVLDALQLASSISDADESAPALVADVESYRALTLCRDLQRRFPTLTVGPIQSA